MKIFELKLLSLFLITLCYTTCHSQSFDSDLADEFNSALFTKEDSRKKFLLKSGEKIRVKTINRSMISGVFDSINNRDIYLSRRNITILVPIDSLKKLVILRDKKINPAYALSAIGGFFTTMGSGLLIYSGISYLTGVGEYDYESAFGLAGIIYGVPILQMGEALRNKKRINFKSDFSIFKKHIFKRKKWNYVTPIIETLSE